jgi:hypothetical protein
VGIKKNYRKKIVYKKNMQKTLRRNAVAVPREGAPWGGKLCWRASGGRQARLGIRGIGGVLGN